MSKKIILGAVIALIVLGGGAAVYYKFYKNNNESNVNQNTQSQEAQTAKVDLPQLDKNLKELETKVLKEGTGKTIEKGNVAYVIYAGFLPDGTVFDTNTNTGQPVGFPIGEGAVIKGWDQALLGVKEGTELIIDIPADLAYGEKGIEGRIPPNSPLRFDVLVVKVFTKEELKKLQEEAQKQTENKSDQN
jgi:peptidylprolyl isomerase